MRATEAEIEAWAREHGVDLGPKTNLAGATREVMQHSERSGSKADSESSSPADTSTAPAQHAQATAGAASPHAGTAHVLWVPGWTPGALNKKLWKHWSVAAKAQKADKAAIQIAVLMCGTPKATRPRKVELYMLLGKGRRCLDPDAVWKGLLDGLVAAGALVNDSPAWCRIEQPNYLRCLHGAAPGAFVVLTDL